MSRRANKKGTRLSYEDLGLSSEMLLDVVSRCRAGDISAEVMRRACADFEYVADFIILSATKRLSYDRLEFNSKLGRIPCGRSNFYSYRRQFYRNLSEALRESGGNVRSAQPCGKVDKVC